MNLYFRERQLEVGLFIIPLSSYFSLPVKLGYQKVQKVRKIDERKLPNEESAKGGDNIRTWKYFRIFGTGIKHREDTF